MNIRLKSLFVFGLSAVIAISLTVAIVAAPAKAKPSKHLVALRDAAKEGVELLEERFKNGLVQATDYSLLNELSKKHAEAEAQMASDAKQRAKIYDAHLERMKKYKEYAEPRVKEGIDHPISLKLMIIAVEEAELMIEYNAAK